MGKEGKCSRCFQEKMIEYQTSIGTREMRYCKDCWEEIHSCLCEFCFQKVEVDVYYNHLVDNHALEDLAKLISQRMKESKNKPYSE